jgi:hypothetical protein
MTALILRDIRIGVRAGGGMLIGILFFLAVIAVVPFGVGPDLNLLARIGPAILWIGALLASLLGLDRLFQADREDGSLDILILQGHEHPLALTVFAKCIAHWLTTGLPLVIVSPALGLLMNMEPAAILATTVDIARRHAGHHLHRRDRRGAGRRPAARRAARLGAGAALRHSRPYFRRDGRLWSGGRPGALHATLPAGLRADLLLCRFGAACGRSGAEGKFGLTGRQLRRASENIKKPHE